MRLNGWNRVGLLAGALLALAPRAASAFDIDYQAPKDMAKIIQVERTGPAEDFGDHVVLYLRFIPVKGNRVFPAFINTHNYLTCPDAKDKKWLVNNVAEVDFHKRSGVKILGFFFDKPTCDNPTYHLETVNAET
jgi:hypothetical protein